MAGERTLKVTIVGDADRLSNTFEGLGTDLGGFGSKLDDLAGKFPALSGHVDGLKTKLGGLSGGQLAAIGGVAAVGAAAVVAGKQLYGLGSDFDSAYDKIQINTGKTGADLEKLKTAFRNVAREVPSSFGDVSTAIADVSVKTGATGETLDELAVQFLNLSRLTGTDLASNVDVAAKAFQDFGIPAADAGKHLDYVFTVAQQTGQPLGDLLSTVDKFGPGLKGMGIEFDDAARMAGTLAQRGVDVDKVFQGLTKAFVQGAKDVGKAQEDVGKAQQRYQDTVERTEQKVADARERAKEKTVAAAEKIRDVEDRLKDAVADAADRKEQAQQRYQDAVDAAAARVTDAEQRLVEVTEDAAERVKDAKESEAEVAENVAERIADAEASAIERVENASERVASAKERQSERMSDAADKVREAEEALAQAQLEGAKPEEIERLSARIETAKKNQAKVTADAAKDVAKAEKEQAKVTADAAKDVEKAKEDGAKAVEDARDRVADAEAKVIEVAQKAAEGVGLAKDDETKARDRAQQELDRIEKASQKSVEDAQKAVDKARQESKAIHEEVVKAEQAAKEEVAKARAEVLKAEEALEEATRKTAETSNVTKDKLGELITRIQESATEEDALATASEIMGTKVSAEFVSMVREGKLQLSDLKTSPTGGLDATQGAINKTADDTDDAEQRMAKAWNRTKVALEPLATKVFEFGGYVAEKLSIALEAVSTFLTDTLPPAIDTALTWLGKLLDIALTPVTAQVDLIKSGLDLLPGAVNVIKAPFEAVFGAVMAAIQPIVDAMKWIIEHLPKLPSSNGGVGGSGMGVSQSGDKVKFQNGRWVYDGGPKNGQPVPESELSSEQRAMSSGSGGGPSGVNSQGGAIVTPPAGAVWDPNQGWVVNGQVWSGTGTAIVQGAAAAVGALFGGDYPDDNDGDHSPAGGPGEANLTPNAVTLRRGITNNFHGFTSIGGYAYRTTAAGTPSDHATGKALDVMMPSLHNPLGDSIAAWAIGQSQTKYVIWDNQIWSRQHPAWRDYATSGAVGRANQSSPTGRHEDHVHISVLGRGGYSVGGGWSVVGDEGPELRYLPPGEGIVPLSHPIAQAAMGGASSPSIVVNVTVNGNVMRERDLALSIRDALIKAKREGVTIGLG